MRRPNRTIVMLGTDFSAPGGITAVVRMYSAGGLFDNWPVRFLPTYCRSGVADRLRAALVALFRFLGWLARGEVGWVHAHVAARGSFWRKSLFLTLGRLAGARTIFHLHDGSFPAWYAGRSEPVRRLVCGVLRHSDRVIVLSQTWADWVRTIEPRAKTTVIGNPVALPREASKRQPGTILFLGRLWHEKGIFDLLNAAAILGKSIPGFRLICAGDGDHALVRETAASLGIADRVLLPGWVDGKEKQALLEQAAVFVLPSYFEGLPMGVLEAMAHGIPVVATDVGGLSDAVGDDAGILVSAGDVEALAGALKDVLCNSALQAYMGAAGRRRVATDFETHRVLDRLGEVYRDLGVLPRPAGRIHSMQEPV